MMLTLTFSMVKHHGGLTMNTISAVITITMASILGCTILWASTTFQPKAGLYMTASNEVVIPYIKS